jgi:cytochrome c553
MRGANASSSGTRSVGSCGAFRDRTGTYVESTDGVDKRRDARSADKCAVCHGFDGLRNICVGAEFRGTERRYLIEQLGAFQAGVRTTE